MLIAGSGCVVTGIDMADRAEQCHRGQLNDRKAEPVGTCTDQLVARAYFGHRRGIVDVDAVGAHLAGALAMLSFASRCGRWTSHRPVPRS